LGRSHCRIRTRMSGDLAMARAEALARGRAAFGNGCNGSPLIGRIEDFFESHFSRVARAIRPIRADPLLPLPLSKPVFGRRWDQRRFAVGATLPSPTFAGMPIG
jgi:hypothetical protein